MSLQSPPTRQEFLDIFSEFSSMPTGKIQFEIDSSAQVLDTSAWGDFYFQAVCLEAAHNLVLASIVGSSPKGGMQAAVGQITSSSAAGTSTSFSSENSGSKDISVSYYNKTSYGQRFLLLRNRVIGIGDMAI